MTQITDLLKDSRPAELSPKTGLSADRLEELAQGADPNMAELRRLAAHFRLDVRELLPPGPKEKAADLLFRHTRFGGDERTVSSLSRQIGYSMQLFAEHKGAVSWWSGHFRRDQKSYAEAEANASVFRTLFFAGDELSPLLALPKIAATAVGVVLFVIKNSKIDGASAFIEGLPFVFVSERFPPRMLFTLAHELGHLVAHHDPATSYAVMDTQSEHVGTKQRKHGEEFYAHAFASCLLMPARSVGIALDKIRKMQGRAEDQLGDLEILLLAHIYGVSFYVAAKRCEDLGLLPSGGAASLSDVITKKYGSPEKRAEQANLPPRPPLEFPRVPEALLAAALKKVRSGDLSIGRASAVLGLSIADLISANVPSTH